MCVPALLTHTPGLPIALRSLTFKALRDAAAALTHSLCVPPTPEDPISRTFHLSPLHRTDKEADGDFSRSLAPAPEGPHEPAEEAHQAPEAAPREEEPGPTGPGAPDVFHALQNALSALEAAAAAWRHRPPGRPGPTEEEGRSEEGQVPCWEQEGAGCRREAARLSERNAWLRLALGSREDELIRTQASLKAIQAEKAMLQREVSGTGLPPRAPRLREEVGPAWAICSFEKPSGPARGRST